MKLLLAVAACIALGIAAPVLAGAREPRIVALMPSLAEDLFALGAGADLVGVSEYTDYPPAAKTIPRVASATSVDAEKIVALHPDVVVGIPAQAAMVAPLIRAHVHVELLRDDRLDDIYTTLTRLGALLERREAASNLERRMHNETARLVHLARSDSNRIPSVFVVLDVQPIYTVGRRSYINTLIEMAGGRNAAQISAAYGRYSAESLLAMQPDVIVVDPIIGFRSIENREPWRSLRAVQNGRVAQIPDSEALLQPGPRYNEALRWLIGVLHPSAISR